MGRLNSSVRISFAIVLLLHSFALGQKKPINIDEYIQRIAEGRTSEVSSLLPDLRTSMPGSPALLYVEGLIATEGDRSVSMFRVIADSFRTSEWADDAIARLYELYRSRGMNRHAFAELERLRNEHPSSPYITTHYLDPDEGRAESMSDRAGSEYAVQVGAFAIKSNATKLQQKIQLSGYEVDVYENLLDGKHLLYLVWVGNFKTAQEAALEIPKIKARHHIDGVVRIRNTWKKW